MKFPGMVGLLLIIALPVQGEEQRTAPSEDSVYVKPGMSVRQLKDNNVELIGDLGLPLGTAAELIAEITSAKGRDRVGKWDGEGKYLLKVTHVNRQPLPTPVILEFVPHHVRKPALANNSFDLFELKKGRRIGSLDDAQRREIEEGYLNRTVNVIAYETGAFEGTPTNLPGEMTFWQDTNYHFKNYLIVMSLRERKATKAVPKSHLLIEQSAR